LVFGLQSILVTYYSLKYPELFKRKRATTLTNANKTKEDSENQINIYKDKLEEVMEQTSAYTNPDITIKDVATLVGTNTHTLSMIINEKYQKNFNDFINLYRVKAFIKKFEEDKTKNFTQLSFDVGFNSKATFNRAFKKVTGFTPSEYFNQ
jgi:AraC-like DNA-binding protein